MAVFAALFAFATTALAQEITLTSKSGGFELSGEVLGFDGNFVRLDTIYGELTADYSRVNCQGAACPDIATFLPTLRLSGSFALGDVLIPALIETYTREAGFLLDVNQSEGTYVIGDSAGPRLLIQLTVSVSDLGLADLLANRSDIALMNRELTEKETTDAQDAGLGRLESARQGRILALGGLVPIVHPANPTDEISLSELAKIISGEIVDWSELGAPTGAIHVVLPAPETGLSQDITARVLRPFSTEVVPTAMRLPTGGDISKTVLNDEQSLGLVGFEAVGQTTPLGIVGGCGVAMTATQTSLRTQDYPLTAPLFLYAPMRRQPPETADFLRWLHSPSAQIVIRRSGLVDLTGASIPIANQGDRLMRAIGLAGRDFPVTELQRLARVLNNGQRLSTTFRFEAGSTRLDAQSRSNLLAIAQEISAGKFNSRRLLLLGFSDGRGPYESNRDLSAARANSARRSIASMLGGEIPANIDIETYGFGEALPIGCDETEWGRQMNRRVEVWVID